MSRIRTNLITNRMANGAPTVSNGLVISGVTTVTTLDLNGDIDVDGHTNLDNVNISGISSTGNIYITTGGDGRKLSFAGDGSSHYIKMDDTVNGPIINGYGGIAFETNGTNERLRIDSSGRLLLGSGAVANPKSSGAGSIDLDNQAFSIMVGGNHPSGGRSNNNAKTFRMSMVHYALAEEPINILQGYCDSSDNNVYIGGGTGSANSLTSVRIYTGANTTTTGGTERFRIHSAGQIGLSGANYGSAGQVLTSAGSGSAATWAAAGITMADQWRISSSFTLGGSVATLTSNWERNDTTGYGSIGSAMTQSSGVFTFPATGIYLIEFVCSMSSTSALRYCGHRIQTTTNNSSYTNSAETLSHVGITNSYGAYVVTSSSFILDVTDTSQCKVRFAGQSITSSVTTILGNSLGNQTFATFTRLGDT